MLSALESASGLFEISWRQSLRRRDFLRGVCGAAAVLQTRRAWPAAVQANRKVVIVTFGGGARDDETFALEGQHNIPHLLNELVPQGVFFTRLVNRGILGHYVATASIATGRYQTFNNFVAQTPASPTVFEYYRKQLRRPADDCWIIAPSNGFQRLGASHTRDHGPDYGAGVILPKRLLSSASATLGDTGGADLQQLLLDSYEKPLFVPGASAVDREFDLTRLTETLQLSVGDFVRSASDFSSPDELSIYIVRQLMRVMAPSLVLITLHDMDVAHCGAYSLYVDAVQRSDRLCSLLWRSIQSDAEYKDRTTLLILPDFGRDADGDAGGNGFQHHRTGSPLARTSWLLALGPHLGQNLTVDRMIESVDVVPTVGRMLGFDATLAAGQMIPELL